ncbi:MAG: S9 family peptidase [Anaerolineaceae bacterium]|nr:S9 family peptidase [Anaerolineaceae bacterium]
MRQRPVLPDDLLQIRSLQEAKFSPDGKRVIYGVSYIHQELELEFTNLWQHSIQEGSSFQLTSRGISDSDAAWSPDGRHIAFLSIREGLPQIYITPPHGGDARPLTQMTDRVIIGGPAWSPDGCHIAFTAGPQKQSQENQASYRVTRHIFRFDGGGNPDNFVQGIFIIPAKGGALRQMTHDECYHAHLRWSPDGKEIMFLSTLQPDSHRLIPQIKIMDMGKNIREILKSWGIIQSVEWMPDGKHIIFCGQKHGLPAGSKSDLWVLNLEGDRPKCRTTGLKFGVSGGLQHDMPMNLESPIAVSPNGEDAYVSIQDGGAIHIYRVALRGSESWQPVVSAERACVLLDIADERLLYAVSMPHKPAHLYISNLDGKDEQEFSHDNKDIISRWDFPPVRHLTFPSIDGQEIEGWIMTPTTGQAPYATILYIHSGPHAAFGNAFSFEPLMLAGAGYAVLLINHRGSSGYGDGFSTSIKGDFGNLDYQDLMAGLDYVIELGIVDLDRLGVCGSADGGRLVCWIVGHKNTFKAAVAENPLTNWVSFYGTADIGAWTAVEELGGEPYEIPDVYRRCSPLTYARECKTPTLLIVGDEDYRYPAEQSEQFYTALKRSGCTTEMLRLPGSSHAGSVLGMPNIRSEQNKALLAWMDKYVLEIEPPSPAFPLKRD